MRIDDNDIITWPSYDVFVHEEVKEFSAGQEERLSYTALLNHATITSVTSERDSQH